MLDAADIAAAPLAELLTHLAGDPAPTQFKSVLLAAIRLFARGVAQPEPEDRLVHAMVALETLLLKNSSGQIKTTLQRRCSVALSRYGSDREKVVDILGRAYKLRSNYLHHGRQLAPDALDTVQGALEVAHKMLRLALAVNDEHVRTRASYCRYLDRMAASKGG